MTASDVMTATAAGMGASPAALAVHAQEAVKVYGKGTTAVHALDGVSLALPAGRFTAIMGSSGSGRSTLMHCRAGLDTLTADGEAAIRPVADRFGAPDVS